MAVYKDKNGTWYVSARYTNWKGEADRKVKRGFQTKREAAEWEKNFFLENAGNLDMTFEAFYQLYKQNTKDRIKLNTWKMKESVIEGKILPYFRSRRMNEIKPRDVVNWQNTMMKMTDENGKPFSPVYLKGAAEATPLNSSCFSIILRLCVPQLVVFTVCVGNERSVRALLNDRTLVEYGDLVAELTRGQTVGDIDCGFVACDLVKLSVNLRFGNRVESCRRLVEDNERSIFVERTGNGDLLCFTTGNVNAVIRQILIEHCVQSLFHCGKAITKTCINQSLMHSFTVVLHFTGDICSKRLTNELKILEHHSEDIHVIVVFVLANINSIKKNLSFLWVIQTAQQFDESCFAATIFANNGKALTDFEFHIHMTECPYITTGIFERYVLELHLILSVTPLFSSQATLIHRIR